MCLPMLTNPRKNKNTNISGLTCQSQCDFFPKENPAIASHEAIPILTAYINIKNYTVSVNLFTVFKWNTEDMMIFRDKTHTAFKTIWFILAAR